MKDIRPVAQTDKICAVVVTYNRKTLLEECLEALQKQTRSLDEIIVIDNASSDGTDDVMKTRFSDITYVKLDENIGGAGGFHDGIKLAYGKGHDWIWVMDDDAIPNTEALEKLESCPLIKDKAVYALASTVLKKDGSISLIHRRIINVSNLKEEPADAGMYEANYFQVDTASFVGLLVGRKAINDIGYPLKEFFIYYDDTEFSLRMKGKGTIYTISNSIIMHPDGWDDTPRSIVNKQALTWRQYYSFRNYIYTYIKYGRPGLTFYSRLLAGIIIEIILTLLFRHDKLRSMKIVIYGRLDGVRRKLGKNNEFLAD